MARGDSPFCKLRHVDGIDIMDEKYNLDLIRNVFMFIAMCVASIPLIDYLSKKMSEISGLLILSYKAFLIFIWLLAMATMIVGVYSFNAGKILFVISCSAFSLILVVFPVIILFMAFSMRMSSPLVSLPSSVAGPVQQQTPD